MGNNVQLLKVIALYDKGVLTDFEFAIMIFERLSEENVDQLCRSCHSNNMLRLQNVADGLPNDTDEEAWAKFRIGYGGYPDPNLTEEDLNRIENEFRRNLRHGVQIFRTLTAKN